MGSVSGKRRKRRSGRPRTYRPHRARSGRSRGLLGSGYTQVRPLCHPSKLGSSLANSEVSREDLDKQLSGHPCWNMYMDRGEGCHRPEGAQQACGLTPTPGPDHEQVRTPPTRQPQPRGNSSPTGTTGPQQQQPSSGDLMDILEDFQNINWEDEMMEDVKESLCQLVQEVDEEQEAIKKEKEKEREIFTVDMRLYNLVHGNQPPPMHSEFTIMAGKQFDATLEDLMRYKFLIADPKQPSGLRFNDWVESLSDSNKVVVRFRYRPSQEDSEDKEAIHDAFWSGGGYACPRHKRLGDLLVAKHTFSFFGGPERHLRCSAGWCSIKEKVDFEELRRHFGLKGREETRLEDEVFLTRGWRRVFTNSAGFCDRDCALGERFATFKQRPHVKSEERNRTLTSLEHYISPVTLSFFSKELLEAEIRGTKVSQDTVICRVEDQGKEVHVTARDIMKAGVAYPKGDWNGEFALVIRDYLALYKWVEGREGDRIIECTYQKLCTERSVSEDGKGMELMCEDLVIWSIMCRSLALGPATLEELFKTKFYNGLSEELGKLELLHGESQIFAVLPPSKKHINLQTLTGPCFCSVTTNEGIDVMLPAKDSKGNLVLILIQCKTAKYSMTIVNQPSKKKEKEGEKKKKEQLSVVKVMQAIAEKGSKTGVKFAAVLTSTGDPAKKINLQDYIPNLNSLAFPSVFLGRGEVSACNGQVDNVIIDMRADDPSHYTERGVLTKWC